MYLDTSTRSSDPPIDLDAAEKLDHRIQRMADTAARNLDTLADLLAKAKAGQVHAVLGFDSWTAYLVDRVNPLAKVLNSDDHRVLITELRDAGMSMRAIAKAVGTSKSTVSRQVSQAGTAGHGAAVQTTGIDGKAYPRRNCGGGHRGPLPVGTTLSRAKTAIDKITGLDGDADALRTQICELIDRLLDSLSATRLDVSSTIARRAGNGGGDSDLRLRD
ncbi:helix-turn-helix domain-containing protein [Mycobacterium sp. IS-1264]|uniref:helix-turn-helix domain-containing protein n=1 Tax=Mycobacterium sp. IS-1264 TaxID=1834158 RepID=UPI000979D8BE|nr:helix-turn-helix domain-containing protein [Mycobacterium sp. IS-1264]OMC39209.1 hypothetical protein A5744_22830 [Mycobacterium sp. IS-1264]